MYYLHVRRNNYLCNFCADDLPAAVLSPRSRPETLSSSCPTGIRMFRDVWRSSPPLYDNIVERTHCFTVWWAVFQFLNIFFVSFICFHCHCFRAAFVLCPFCLTSILAVEIQFYF